MVALLRGRQVPALDSEDELLASDHLVCLTALSSISYLESYIVHRHCHLHEHRALHRVVYSCVAELIFSKMLAMAVHSVKSKV